MSKITNDWLEVLEPEFSEPYYKKLYSFIRSEYNTRTIYPSSEDIFNAYHATPLSEVKVVILGNQPYSTEDISDGLAFSSKSIGRLPEQTKNIFKELQADVGCYIPNNGDLHKWAEQGVFLLNNLLTVRAHAASSHKSKGWEKFTDATLHAINEQDRPIVIMLWGKEAESKKSLFGNPKHLVLTAPHPSPLSAYRGFLGCKHFSKANNFLIANGLSPIDWQIENR